MNAKSKKSIIIMAVISLLALLAVICVMSNYGKLSAATTINDATVQKYEEQIAALNKEQKALESKISGAKQNKASAMEQKSYLDQQIKLSEDKIAAANSIIDELNTKIAEKTVEIEQKNADIEEQYENLKSLLRITYEEGDTNYVEMLLESKSLYDFLVRTERISSIVNYNTRTMKQYEKDKKALDDEKSSLETMSEKQVAYKDELVAEENKLKQAYSENETYLANINWNEAKYQEELKEIRRKEAEYNEELERYIKEQQAKANMSYVGGEFMWPMDPSHRYISSYYGWRVLYGVQDFHQGIDIPASTGTPIYASNAGTVIKVVPMHYSYGNYLIIDHGSGKSTLYAHASKLLVVEGQKVSQGQTVALVGSTGNSTGPHLHFEVRINGKHTNPLDYVTQP